MPHETLTIHGVKYIAHSLCSFGDYDNSSDVERSNVLTVLRWAVGAASFTDSMTCSVGHLYGLSANYLRYSGSLEDLSDEKAQTRSVSSSVLRDVIREHLDLYGRAPDVIHHVGSHGYEAVLFSERFDEEYSVLDSLRTYPVLCELAQQEVEMAIQWSGWTNYLHEELVSEITRIAPLDVWGLPATSNGELDIPEASVWRAFWEALSDKGNFGFIENTSWCVPNIEKLIPKVVDHLKETLNVQVGQKELPLVA